jgi:hypothetical protein
MHVGVPQFIDIEDKIAFGLTAKQLLWMGGMVAALFLAYNAFDQQAFYLVGFFIVAAFSGFAFWRPQGVPLIIFVGFILQFYLKPRSYIWKRVFRANDLAVQKAAHLTQRKKTEARIAAKPAPKRSQLKQMAWMLDTKK